MLYKYNKFLIDDKIQHFVHIILEVIILKIDLKCKKL